MASVFDCKFVSLVRTFDEKELRAFKQWLQSPWCNSNKNLPILLAELVKYYPAFESKRLTKEKLFQRVLPDGKFSNRRLNNLMSEGFLAAKDFLLHRRFAQSERLQQQSWAEEMEERHLDSWFLRDVKPEVQWLSEQDVLSWEERLSLFRLQQSIYHHPTESPRNEAGDRTIVRMEEQLDLIFLLEKALIIEEKRHRNLLFQHEGHEVEEAIGQWLALSEGVGHPAVELYRMRLNLPLIKEQLQYETLLKTFTDLLPRLHQREKKLQLLYLINDTMQMIKRGRLDVTALLPLYKIGLRTQLLLHQGKLTRNAYTAIIVASNTKGDFGYTQHFIDTYTTYVDEEDRSDCYRWGNAHTAYWSQQLNKCVDILKEGEFETPYFQYVSRLLRAQAYFDLFLQDDSYRDYLFSYFHNYERWLRRDKSYSNRFNEAFLRFVQKCRQLARFYEEPSLDIGQLENLFDQTANIQALNWLKQKQRQVLQLRQSV